jgi:molybdenum cofactor biosynthesis MoaF-like protein
MASAFPAVGHRFRVDFVAFKVELEFTSDTSLTYYNLDGDKIVGSETVTIKVEPITDQIFLVTWQESDNTTVVHVEKYDRNTIVTNITSPPDLKFDQYHGTFAQLP